MEEQYKIFYQIKKDAYNETSQNILVILVAAVFFVSVVIVLSLVGVPKWIMLIPGVLVLACVVVIILGMTYNPLEVRMAKRLLEEEKLTWESYGIAMAAMEEESKKQKQKQQKLSIA
jgi:hypothetical protein